MNIIDNIIDNTIGADHTYGVTFDDDGNLYVSFQHTNSVLRYEHDSFRPMEINRELESNRNFDEYFPGKNVIWSDIHIP